MTREDIIRMAKECGNWSGQTVEMNDVGLERFANLVVAAIEERQWQGLTDEERGQVINENFGTGLWQMAKDIEARLKEKNT